MTQQSFDVAILGAGLSGRIAAWLLSRAGARVALVERMGPDGAGSAAHVAAAMLAPLAESAIAERRIVELGIASVDLWRAWVAELPEPVFFQEDGTLVVWHARDRAEMSLFTSRVRAVAPPELVAERMRALDARGVAELEPALAGRFQQGLLLAGEGQLDNRGALRSLLHCAVAEGVHCVWEAGEVEAGDLPGLGIRADVVLDCRGLGARRDWPAQAAGGMPGLRGLRGEVVRVHAPEVKLHRPVRLLHPRYPIYIAPKPNDLYVIGATELESEDDSPMSVRSALELLSAAYSLDPAFGEARVLELNVQRRPTRPDHLPAIRVDQQARVVRLNGLYRHGFLIAPAVTEAACAVVRALLGGDPAAHAVPAALRWPGMIETDASRPLATLH
ncbi:cytochrome C biogenesis protein CcdA [Cupriavidus sp. USMAA2-4]|uniref:D-amino-acid oxidase n=1 Tax=Cupriavidus malaysiensis TaxID=367825 RepID=A0ABN4TCI5_9BURK|nr:MULTISPECIES: FAD-dependent oxidoreductase [Cupriavidus]AOY91981.1 cytochrome C biogenesis protein CcdA [Cupriavidus sp. USMAA2-4]AOY98459.1 cytochrome C biogenesis protein CcdA [Cupriavidus sp. USMAHM13]AOZ04889.1 cytochrome C biogenesis protein CcdA [Cupriavidus malaysiensis]